MSNTIPLIFLGAWRLNSTRVFGVPLLLELVCAGVVAWGLGSPGVVHVGASGMFGLIGFFLVAGLVQRRILAFLAAVLVGFLYGTALLTTLPIYRRHQRQLGKPPRFAGWRAGGISFTREKTLR